MEQNSVNIYSSDHFRVDFFMSSRPSGRLLVTFTEHSNRTLDGLGFGGAFAMASGFDLIAVKSVIDNWYQTLPPEIFDLIEQCLDGLPERHALRATYGSSMGGYAAVLFARIVKADVAFALSPQFDISQTWDPRWSAQARRLGGIRRLDQKDIRRECKYVIMYDPADLDGIHFEEFSKVIPSENLRPLKVPYAGHPVGYYLNSAGVMKDVALAILNGWESPSYMNKIRSCRDAFPNYYYNLSKKCHYRKKRVWSKSLIMKAISLVPLNAEYQIQAAMILEARKDVEGALSHAALAAALSPKHPHMLATLSRLLQKKGMHAQALHHIEAALALTPDSTTLMAQHDAIQRAMEPGSLRKS